MSSSATLHAPGPAGPPFATDVPHRTGPRSWLAGTLAGEMVAEFFGTVVLIAFGCGSVTVAVVGLPD